jgi:broad specificity phosphatase PhoE
MTNLWLIRHAETEWALLGRHTGRTDLPLTASGEEQAARLGKGLAGRSFALVLTSPLRRAADTCRIAGYGAVAHAEDDLMEYDYGELEGRTTADIRREFPGWNIWAGPVPGGESIEQVGARADRVIARAARTTGDVALFAHGHVLRILALRFLGLPSNVGAIFALDPASTSVLGLENDAPLIRKWNQTYDAVSP